MTTKRLLKTRMTVLPLALLTAMLWINSSVFSQSYSENWETGKNTMWRVQGTDTPPLISTTKALGTYSFRSYLPAKKVSNPRHEIVFKGTDQLPYNYDFFTTYGERVAIFVPSNFKPDYTSREMILQFHGQEDSHDSYVSPPFALYIDGMDFSAKARWIKRDPGHPSDQVDIEFGTVAKVQPGKWHYFYIDFNFDYRQTGNGFLRVYMKTGGWPSASNKIIDYKGPIGSKDQNGHYSKFGIYKWNWKDGSRVWKSKNSGVDHRMLYYDNIRIQKGAFITSSSGTSGTSGTSGGTSTSGSSTEISGFGVSAGDDFAVDVDERNFDLKPIFDPSANITKFEWRKVSGPNCKIDHRTKSIHVHWISEGTYEFEVKVTSGSGQTATDRVKVYVYQGTPPDIPTDDDGSSSGSASTGTSSQSTITVSAGPDLTVYESERNFDLIAEWDNDIDVEDIQWRKVSGPNCKIEDKGRIYHVHWISDGDYVFEVKLTDSDGHVATDRVNVKVINDMGSTINSDSEFDDFIQESLEYGVTRNFMTDGESLKLVNGASQVVTQLTLLTIEGRALNNTYRNGVLNTNELSPGMYIYNVIDEEGSLVQKGRIIRR